MKLPQRPGTHLAEAKSWRLLESIAPDNWIVREVTERDYGIDAYIEICSLDGAVTGDLISIQLKAVNKIDWKGAAGSSLRGAISPSIRVETVNYWLNLPVPVFLFVADLSAGNIYYAPTEHQTRNQYQKIVSNATVTFQLLDNLDLSSPFGLLGLMMMYQREKLHPQFTVHVTNILSNIDTFLNFILENQGRDFFMPVEGLQHIQFRALYAACRQISFFLGIEWKVETLEALYDSDQKQWQDPYTYLHEQTLDRALQQIEELFPSLIRSTINLVTKTQSSYWLDRDPIFFNLCGSSEIEQLLQQFEQRAKQ
jgi:hypothetical protein